MKTFLRLAIASSLTTLICPYALAQDASQGEGVVLLGEEVVDSACGLELSSIDQTILAAHICANDHK